MESLRSRPSQAPRKAQRAGKLVRGVAGATPRDPRTSRVDDKIKKRMSMRYAEISGPKELQNIPPVPNFASQMTSEPKGGVMLRIDDGKDRNDALEEAKVVADDKKLLGADDFDPEAFLRLKLANSTEAELQSLQSSLRNAKDQTASELQQSVFKNYAEFVLISKEISVLENEMLELKDLLSDYKSMPATLHIPDPTSSPSSLLSTYKRSSVADLRVLYFNQMQALHSAIEGAAKFVPTTPGRHVVGEMEGVLSLNAATYKVVGKVKFVVLDDAVLVARRRRRNGGGGEGNGSVSEGKLVAERCWNLNEMLVLDTKDSPNMSNVFKIRHGKETHVYRAETAADKKALLSQFRQVAEELSSKRRKEREGEHERRKSLWQVTGGGDRNSTIPPVPDWMADLARRGGDIPGTGNDAKEKAERDARFVGEWSDDLTVAIALKEWEKATDLIEQGQAKVLTIPLLSTKVPQLKAQLTSSLLASLALPSNRKSTVVTLISLLNRLKAGAAARSAFLEMRSGVLRAHVRKIRFQGHVGAYIGDLAIVYFTGIKHTADWYLASFKENEVASAFITWAKKELESYGEIFRRQVYSKDVERSVVDDAMEITYTQSRKLLEEYGLDFRFLLDDVLLEHPKDITRLSPAFSLHDHRMSKDIRPSGAAQKGSVFDTEFLAAAPPPPPSIAAPSLDRRRSPRPPSPTVPLPPPPIGTQEALYLPPSSALKRGNSLANLSEPNSPASPNGYNNNTNSNKSNAPLLPTSAVPSPRSVYPGRARTPVAGVNGNGNGNGPNTPTSVPIPLSPVPLRTRSPIGVPPARTRSPVPNNASALSRSPARVRSPPADGPLPRPASGLGVRERLRELERQNREREERMAPPPKSLRGSPVPRSPAPPPRSLNRPGSFRATPPVAVPQREGMI